MTSNNTPFEEGSVVLAQSSDKTCWKEVPDGKLSGANCARSRFSSSSIARSSIESVLETTQLRYWVSFFISPLLSAILVVVILKLLRITPSDWASAALLLAIPGIVLSHLNVYAENSRALRGALRSLSVRYLCGGTGNR